jgi:hypothetical protein
VKIQRWQFHEDWSCQYECGAIPLEYGDYVRFSDHEAALAAALTAERERVAKRFMALLDESEYFTFSTEGRQQMLGIITAAIEGK